MRYKLTAVSLALWAVLSVVVWKCDDGRYGSEKPSEEAPSLPVSWQWMPGDGVIQNPSFKEEEGPRSKTLAWGVISGLLTGRWWPALKATLREEASPSLMEFEVLRHLNED